MELTGKRALVLGLGESGLAMARWLARFAPGGFVRVADSRETPPNVEALRASVPGAELFTGGFPDAAFAGVDFIAISPGVPVQTPQVQAARARGVPVVSEIELFVRALRRYAPESRVIAITGSNGKTTTTALTAHLLNSVGIPAVACGNISPSALDALQGGSSILLDMPRADAPTLAPGSLPPGGGGSGKGGSAPKGRLRSTSPHPQPLPREGGGESTVWVLELSSYQLETTYSLNAAAATVLNVSEDHLDRYDGMDDYAAAKARVFQDCGLALINRDDPRCRGWSGEGRKTASFGLNPPPAADDYGLVDGWLARGGERLLRAEDLKLAGSHNVANALAALALCEAVGARPAALVPALRDFRGLPHRVEFVAEVNGVAWYDDSKGTNVGATLAALRGLNRRIALILGGEGKDQDFSPLKPALAEHARAVALIGRDAPLIARAIEGCGVETRRCADLEDAVRWCASAARPGDAALLSPACASFDMFRDYKHRAEVFVHAVRALEGEAR